MPLAPQLRNQVLSEVEVVVAKIRHPHTIWHVSLLLLLPDDYTGLEGKHIRSVPTGTTYGTRSTAFFRSPHALLGRPHVLETYSKVTVYCNDNRQSDIAHA